MTCVVGIETPNGVVMGADSFSGTENGEPMGLARKVVRRGEWLIALSGSCRAADLIQYGTIWRSPPTGVDLKRFIVMEVTPALSKLKADGACVYSEKDGGGTYYQFQLLLGIRGKVFAVHSDLSVARREDGFDAIGSGQPYALGALAAAPLSWSPRRRVLAALRAAERFAGGVRRPFRVVSGGPR